jgi:hypothetical protein
VTNETAQLALEALWAAMVELVEAGHDRVVNGQAGMQAADAARIEGFASELAQLAHAAAALSRHAANTL